MADAFDLSSIAALFFDRRGKVVRVNEKAALMLGSELDVVGGELIVRGSAAATTRRHIRGVLSGASFAEPEGGAVFVPRIGRRPLILKVIRLNGFTFDVFAHAIAIAIVVDPEERREASVMFLRNVYQLTAQEARMARYLAKGLGAKEIADRLGLNYETVRTHVKNVMRKTDTRHQHELAALLASLSQAAG